MTCSSLANRTQGETLPELLVRVSAGETRAFAELHTMTRGKLRRIALAVGTAPHDVDDILQESFLKIWRNAVRFNPNRASAMTWMAAIVRHTAIDRRRGGRRPGGGRGGARAGPAAAGRAPTEP